VRGRGGRRPARVTGRPGRPQRVDRGDAARPGAVRPAGRTAGWRVRRGRGRGRDGGGAARRVRLGGAAPARVQGGRRPGDRAVHATGGAGGAPERPGGTRPGRRDGARTGGLHRTVTRRPGAQRVAGDARPLNPCGGPDPSRTTRWSLVLMATPPTGAFVPWHVYRAEKRRRAEKRHGG